MPGASGYAIVAGVAAAVTFVLTPLVSWLSRRFGLVVAPDERRVHVRPTPAVGGVAMFIGVLAALYVASRMGRFGPLFRDNSEPVGVVLGASVMFATGLIDDVLKSLRPGADEGLSAPAKTTGIVIAGAVLAWLGVTMFYFRIPFFDVVAIGSDFAPLVTVLWLFLMANAINLIDGLDGLAAGIVAIASGTFLLYGHRLAALGLLPEPNIGPLVAAVALGVCVGFLPFNFNPARIFMGDSGALLLGALMAASTSVVGGRADPNQAFSGQTYFFFAPLFIPIIILGIPIVDSLFAVLRRARHRAGVTKADKDHLHHRLMRLGHGQRRSVLILWLWTAILSGFVLYPAYTGEGNGIVPFGMAALALALFTVLHPDARSARSDAA
jgi:UDP-GlcNAc:undecaprenyl-phosphate GlcNAc-1-phosphate transferase